MSRSGHELSTRGIERVAAWAEGRITDVRSTGYHVQSPVRGRLRVHSRSRAAESLRWFGVPDPRTDDYDAAVLIEFDADDDVAAAWLLTRDEVRSAATSQTVRRGRKILKLPVGGTWARRRRQIDLASYWKDDGGRRT